MDGSTLLTDTNSIFQRWSEHFEDLVSKQNAVQGSSLAKIPEADVKLELDDPPTREEMKKATMQLEASKSPGIDGIPAEVSFFFFFSFGGEAVLDKLQDLFTNCWMKGSITVSLYKNKGGGDQAAQITAASPYSPLQANLGSLLAPAVGSCGCRN